MVNHIELQLAHAPRNAEECRLQSHAVPGTSNQEDAGMGGLYETDWGALLLLASSGFGVAETTAKHNPNHDSGIFNKCLALLSPTENGKALVREADYTNK